MFHQCRPKAQKVLFFNWIENWDHNCPSWSWIITCIGIQFCSGLAQINTFWTINLDYVCLDIGWMNNLKEPWTQFIEEFHLRFALIQTLRISRECNMKELWTQLMRRVSLRVRIDANFEHNLWEEFEFHLLPVAFNWKELWTQLVTAYGLHWCKSFHYSSIVNHFTVTKWSRPMVHWYSESEVKMSVSKATKYLRAWVLWMSEWLAGMQNAKLWHFHRTLSLMYPFPSHPSRFHHFVPIAKCIAFLHSSNQQLLVSSDVSFPVSTNEII